MGCEEITQRPYLHALLCSVIYHVTHVVCSEDLVSYVPSLIEAQVPPSAALFPPWQRGEKWHCCILNPLRGRTMPSFFARCDVFTLQEFDTDFITIACRGAELRQLWNALVLGEAADGLLGRHDQQVSMDHFLNCVSNKLASSSASKT